MSPHLLLILAVSAILITISAALLLRMVKHDDKLAARVRSVRSGGVANAEFEEASTDPGLLRIVGLLGAAMARTGMLPASSMQEAQQTLNTAGFRGPHAVSQFMGGKILMMLLMPLTTWGLFYWLGYSPHMRLIGGAMGLVVGLLAPNWTVQYLRGQHLKGVERGLPDALDLMVICAEAGLALEPAITRVGREIAPAHPHVGKEFLLTANELRIVADHKAALAQMASRTGVEGVKRLTTTMMQTLQYGTPLTDALRVLSSELRQELITRFEARAARLPVLLTLPMIIFILPCVFLVVGGPAIIQVIRVFKG